MTDNAKRSLFVEIRFDLHLNVIERNEPDKPLESTSCEKVTPPARDGSPRWVVVVGAGGADELRARRAAMQYLLSRTRPALSAARDYFQARDRVAAAEHLKHYPEPSSPLAGEVYQAAEFLDQCDEFARGIEW
jgi:hypothetical protein